MSSAHIERINWSHFKAVSAFVAKLHMCLHWFLDHPRIKINRYMQGNFDRGRYQLLHTLNQILGSEYIQLLTIETLDMM